MLNNYLNYFFIGDRNRLTIKSLCWSIRGANCCCLPVASAQWPLLAKYEFLTVNPSPWSKPAPWVLALVLSAWSISPTTCGGSVSTSLNTPPWRSSFSCLLVSLLHHLYHPNIFPSVIAYCCCCCCWLQTRVDSRNRRAFAVRRNRCSKPCSNTLCHIIQTCPPNLVNFCSGYPSWNALAR